MQCIIMENTLIKLTLHDETKKRAHNSQMVRAKENLQLSHGGSSYTKASGTSPPIKALRQCLHVRVTKMSCFGTYSITSMARTSLAPCKIVLAKGSSSHPGWLMHKKTFRDHNGSCSQPRRMSHQSSSP